MAKPYENTDNCWALLSQASKAARYLGLVDAADFEDKRNPDAVVNASGGEPDVCLWVRDGYNAWAAELPAFPEVPGYALGGYAGSQDYLLEVWCEKSTMNDVLVPLCQRYQANLVTGLGELSVTAVLAAARRIEADGRPARLLYVSDFDPAGQCMPVSVARKLEYFVSELRVDSDVRLLPVALTLEQCQDYRLPRTPIKEKELRRAGFEERYGEGATELDALEALHPGELGRVMAAALEHYYDVGLEDRVDEAMVELRGALDEQERVVRAAHQQEIQGLRVEYEQLRRDFTGRMAGYDARRKALWHAISAELEEGSPVLEDYPVPGPCEASELGAGLYESEREYLEQIGVYKAFQGRSAALEGLG
jgi:hypothetical protein